MQRVPTELITDVLGYLSHNDLRNAAGVAHRFYRAAQDAGCRVSRTVDLARPVTLATFWALVKHAAAKPACDRPGIGLRMEVSCPSATRRAVETDFGLALQAIAASLPLLVHLEVYVPTFLAEALHRTLSTSPAQRLRSLSLGQTGDRSSPAIALPGDLFANTAPRLRVICLVLPTLDAAWQPVAVFQQVLSARLVLHRVSRPILVCRFLPHLRSLAVRLWNNGHDQTAPELNLSGLYLRHLAIHCHTLAKCTLSGVDLTKIQVFECGDGTVVSDRVWTTAAPSNAPMSAHFGCSAACNPGFPMNAVTLQSAGFIRTALSNAMILSPIGAAQGIGTRLTVVLLSGQFLSDFLRTEEPLLALSELYIDLTLGTGLSDLSRGTACIRCPALQLVTLFTRERPHALHSYRVAMLGEILNQSERPKNARAVLKLVRICFLRPVARRQLERIFPRIYTDEDIDPKVTESCISQDKTPFVLPWRFVCNS